MITQLLKSKKKITGVQYVDPAGAPDYTITGYLTIIGTTIMMPIDVQGTTIMMPVDIQGQTMNVAIDIAAQTIETLKVDITAQTLAQLNVNIAASAVTLAVDIAAQTLSQLNVNIAAQAITLSVDIVAQTLTTLNINIAAQTLGTLKIDITAQTVDLNIKTSAGTNIIIDKLIQEAYTSRRAEFRNDNGIETPTAPPSSLTGVAYKGKFFPRGSRGLLAGVAVYCMRTGTGTITLAFSPYPGAGEIGRVTITPGTDWDWKWGNPQKMWNYDSMFIWIVRCDADVSYGYDSGTPPDGFSSGDYGATWVREARRYFLRHTIDGATVGDVPVSGTLNTIRIPNTLTDWDFFESPSIDGGETYDILSTSYGVGQLTAFQVACVESAGTVYSSEMWIGIVVDGEVFEFNIYDVRLAVRDMTNTISRVSMGEINVVDHYYQVSFNFPISFRRSIRIYARNSAAAGNMFIAQGFYAIERLV